MYVSNSCVLVCVDVLDVILNTQTFSSRFDTGGLLPDSDYARRIRELYEEENGYEKVGTMLTVDPPDHTRYRKLVSKAFTPRVIAALEAVDAGQKGRASAYVLAGGVLAALLAPSLALWSRNALAQPFVGAYLLIAVLALAGLLLMALLREGQAPRPARLAWRDIGGLLRRPVVRAAIACTATGHGLMILIMNATPLAMSFCGLPLEQSSRVIQWHVLGMFLPAFFAGALVDRIGNRRVALLGAFLLAASAGIALGGQSVMHFLLSSLALGSGWNLMLIAGTTLLSEGHAESERGAAQGLMEQGNSLVAALMSFGSGALITSLGWNAVNLLVWPALLVALALLWPVRRTRTLSR